MEVRSHDGGGDRDMWSVAASAKSQSIARPPTLACEIWTLIVVTQRHISQENQVPWKTDLVKFWPLAFLGNYFISILS